MAGLPLNAPAKTSLLNSTYVFKNEDDIKTGKLTLQKNASDTEKIDDPQQFINDIADTQGITENDANRKDYATENFISDGDSQKTCIEKFDVQMKTNRDDIDTNQSEIQAIEDSVGAVNGICPLDANQRVPSANLPDTLLEYQGVWDASTNTPTLTDGTGVQSDWYRCNVAGTVDFGSGNITFAVGDKAVHNGTIWEKWDTTDEVLNVNTKTGAVVLDNTDIGLGNVTNDSQLKRVGADFNTFTEKTSPVGADVLLGEDSDNAFGKVKFLLSKFFLQEGTEIFIGPKDTIGSFKLMIDSGDLRVQKHDGVSYLTSRYGMIDPALVDPKDLEISALDINWQDNDTLYKTIGANSTFTFSNDIDGKTIVIIIENSSGVDVDATFPVGIKYSSDFTNTVVANTYSVFTFVRSNGITFGSVVSEMS